MKLTLIVLVSICTLSQMRATSIVASSSSTGRSVATSPSDTIVANGSLFKFGTFSNPAAISDINPTTLETLAGWTQFDGTGATSSIFGNPGKLTGNYTDITSTADFFNGKLIYVWIFNAPTVAAATQQGIFRASAGSPPWIFPTNNNGSGDSVTLIMDDATMAAQGTVPVGSVSSTRFTLVQIPVPEPTTGTLVCFGVAALAARRRRAVAA